MSPAIEHTASTAAAVGGAQKWQEYLMEAAGLGCFMVSACLFAAVFWHPDSPVGHLVHDEFMRRMLMGLAMGGTAIALIYSPWGQRSGAHLNPAVTLSFFYLGRVKPRDAASYAVFQLAGGVCGVMLAARVAPRVVGSAAVNYVVTVPRMGGTLLAFLAEFGMSFGMMALVLCVSNSRLTRWTGVAAGVAVAVFIGTLSPLSGVSINPARTLASAIPANVWSGVWVYLIAPPLGMLMAAESYRRIAGTARIGCPKLDRINRHRCIFCGSQSGHSRLR